MTIILNPELLMNWADFFDTKLYSIPFILLSESLGTSCFQGASYLVAQLQGPVPSIGPLEKLKAVGGLASWVLSILHDCLLAVIIIEMNG